MCEREIPLEWYTERGVEPPGLSYSVAEHPDWDADDWEVAVLATEIDTADRLRRALDENDRLRTRLAAMDEAAYEEQRQGDLMDQNDNDY